MFLKLMRWLGMRFFFFLFFFPASKYIWLLYYNTFVKVVTVLLEYIDLLIIIITIISCSYYCVWLFYWAYFDLFSAKCVGIPLLENLFSQSLPIMLAFCSLFLQLFQKFCRHNRHINLVEQLNTEFYCLVVFCINFYRTLNLYSQLLTFLWN